MGFAPKYAACESYGRYPGLVGLVGDQIGLPPEWTDSGPKRNSKAVTNWPVRWSDACGTGVSITCSLTAAINVLIMFS